MAHGTRVMLGKAAKVMMLTMVTMVIFTVSLWPNK